MADSHLALRRCLKEPIPEIFEAASLLSEAVDAHRAGDRLRADRLIREADMPAIGDWVLPLVWINKTKLADIRFREVSGAPVILAKPDRVPVRMPTAAQKAELIALYGYNCAFCGIPLVAAKVRKALTAAYPEAARWNSRGDPQCHMALLSMWLQFDHVLPHSRGGDNLLSNVVVTCAGCNYGRMAYTLEEVGVRDPRLTPPTKTAWDGLQRLLLP
ncbi:MAG: HNH endonuclease [Gammaproteobacteria bacterium]|nr:HNH endonuclease [Gammaproteobacteria bacterium]